MGRKLMRAVRDLLWALLIGIAIGCAVGILLLFVGALTGGAIRGWAAARTSLMLLGGFTLVFDAVLLLKGGNLPKDAFELRPWRHSKSEDDNAPAPRKIFRTLGRQYTALAVAVGILLVAIAIDYGMYFWL